ncbi:MAG TPA: methylenetetrahydrofolate reductase [NAD(P)H] [Lachnospiraceae bacterium]|nr:methylenetetrahydrofolate reductase [NAD(P)H] [uncultured Lachnoclostridium sp.]HAU88085.1 methylenetetrahydrofolate reductase [NAD(P)H] [Lachnospiraceae bacterium]
MNIADMFQEDRTVLSYEVFPPKGDKPIESIYDTLDELGRLRPDFISVTYGAAGNVANTATIDIAGYIQKQYQIQSIAHLTCVHATYANIDQILSDLKARGVDNILALRGDIVDGMEPKKDFLHASDLAKYIMDKGGFHVSGACYPEVHQDAKNAIEDIKNLKVKVDSGVDHLISQLFFNNTVFFDFVEKARIAGIDVPIEAGIMPVTNKKQIERMVTMCGASLPAKFVKVMQRFEDNPEALRDAGIAYAIDQIIDLVANGVDGVHIYTMNNPYVARRISEGVESIVRGSRRTSR